MANKIRGPIPRARVCLLALAFTLAFTLTVAAGAQSKERAQPGLLVFAAASLSDVLGELSRHWEKSSGQKVKLSFAASSVLARQIEAGAAAQVFVSADHDWMDYLDARHLLDAASRRNLVGNRLVLVAPAVSKVELTIAPGFKLAEALGTGRLSTGDPDTIPVGRYAKAALESLGVWRQVADKIVPAENVRAAMTYVARGEAPLGIVYATDAAVDSRVRVVATFPADTHPSITYTAAAMPGAGVDAAAYLAFLGGAEATEVWKTFGFLSLQE